MELSSVMNPSPPTAEKNEPAVSVCCVKSLVFPGSTFHEQGCCIARINVTGSGAIGLAVQDLLGYGIGLRNDGLFTAITESIQALVIPKAGIKGRLPQKLVYFKNLEALTLGYARIESIVQLAVFFPRLRYINISSAAIDEITPFQLQQVDFSESFILKNLQYVCSDTQEAAQELINTLKNYKPKSIISTKANIIHQW
jgi:hypothetical protein